MNLFAHVAALALRTILTGPNPVPLGRITPHGARLEQTLQTAVQQSWTALEVTLAGGPLWRRHARPADEPHREYLRTHLDAARHVDRREALRQLQEARSLGLLSGGRGVGPILLLAEGYLPPRDADRHELLLLDELGDALRGSFPVLHQAVMAAPPSGTLLLALAARHFFRSELARDAELLFRWPAHRGNELNRGEEVALDALVRNADAVLASVSAALANPVPAAGPRSGANAPPSGRMPAATAATAELEYPPLTIAPGANAQAIQQALATLHQRYAPPAVCGEKGRAECSRVLELFRQLPRAERGHAALLDLVGDVALHAQSAKTAITAFRAASRLHSAPAMRAASEYGLFRALIAEHNFTEALPAFQEAARLLPARYNVFPMQEYVPQSIVGAGPGGVDFACQHAEFPGGWIVRILPPDPVGKAGQLFAEKLRRVDHPAVQRVLEVCRVGEPGERKTYVVFAAFDGTPLDEMLLQRGPFRRAEVLALLHQLAEGLQAAHERGIVHGAIEPRNIFVRASESGWCAQLQEFPPARQSGLMTLPPDYRPVESVAGKYSDVFGWGKVACYLLFGATMPAPTDWSSIPEELANWIRRCTARDPRSRPMTFQELLVVLGKLL
jgi:tetratricopeptide (TPR) repeat protein